MTLALSLLNYGVRIEIQLRRFGEKTFEVTSGNFKSGVFQEVFRRERRSKFVFFIKFVFLVRNAI